MVIDTYADRLFHRYYLVSIPACDYYEPEYIKKFGMHQHPDKDVANAMLRDRIQDHLSPAYLASWAADGIDIRFHDATDTVKVYDDIMGHLGDWRDFLADGPLIARVPIEGLHQFHVFAKLIYKIAREHGLADKYRRGTHMWDIMALYRKGTNKHHNPFRFQFNGDIWLDILEHCAARGIDVRKYRDADLKRQGAKVEGERTYVKSSHRNYNR
ncbi:MAG: hypothetical protein ACRDDY_13780 [Clostridium sp.]|uniref:hypothetical protein n=1 Tax=Clostridium sp. TaxID=1506 RepID=UPI003EE49EF8